MFHSAPDNHHCYLHMAQQGSWVETGWVIDVTIIYYIFDVNGIVNTHSNKTDKKVEKNYWNISTNNYLDHLWFHSDDAEKAEEEDEEEE